MEKDPGDPTLEIRYPGVARIANHIKQINEEKGWLNLHTLPEARMLLPTIIPIIDRFIETIQEIPTDEEMMPEEIRRLSPQNRDKNTLWKRNLNANFYGFSLAARNGRMDDYHQATHFGRQLAHRSVFDTAFRVFGDGYYFQTKSTSFGEMEHNAELAIAWEIVADISNVSHNPFELLLELRQHGMTEFGFKPPVSFSFAHYPGMKDDDFFAHFGLRSKGDKKELGCWSRDDPTILYSHPWTSSCGGRKQIL